MGQRQSADGRGDGDVGPRRDRDLRRAEGRCDSRDRDPGRRRDHASRRGRRTATPSASPGCIRGITDLFVYDLQANRLRQLTKDAFADLQPAWSPDGRRIAFSTDRFSSNLTTLAFGPYTLAVHRSRRAALFSRYRRRRDGKHINPQWSPDGRSIYFISDRDGISNIYRTTFDESDCQTTQVTTVMTGVSGITSLSPAMSVASKAGTVAFSVYQDGKYDIRTLDREHSGVPCRPASDERRGAASAREERASEVAIAAGDTGARVCPSRRPTRLNRTRRSSRLKVWRSQLSASASAGSVRRSAGDSRSRSATSWQSPARHRCASQHRHRRQHQREGHRRAGGLHEHVAPLELGARRRADSHISVAASRAPSAGCPNGDLVAVRSALRLPADGAQRLRRAVVSARSVATPRVPGRREQHLLRSDRARPRRSRSAPARYSRTPPRRHRSRETLNLGTELRRLRVRHVGLRRDEPGAGAAVSIRGVANVRHDQFHRAPRRLSPLLHAGAVLHDRRSRRCTTAVTAAARRTLESRRSYVGYPWLVRGYDVDSIDSDECVPTPRPAVVS